MSNYSEDFDYAKDTLNRILNCRHFATLECTNTEKDTAKLVDGKPVFNCENTTLIVFNESEDDNRTIVEIISGSDGSMMTIQEFTPNYINVSSFEGSQRIVQSHDRRSEIFKLNDFSLVLYSSAVIKHVSTLFSLYKA